MKQSKHCSGELTCHKDLQAKNQPKTEGTFFEGTGVSCDVWKPRENLTKLGHACCGPSGEAPTSKLGSTSGAPCLPATKLPRRGPESGAVLAFSSAPRLELERASSGAGFKLATPSSDCGNGQMAVGQKKVPKDGTLVSGSMDQNLRSPGGLILTHTQIGLPLTWNQLQKGTIWVQCCWTGGGSFWCTPERKL